MKNPCNKIETIDWIMIGLLLGSILFCILMAGCRSENAYVVKSYANGAITQEVIYTEKSGWSFWSEGPGKTITISPTVNGVQF